MRKKRDSFLGWVTFFHQEAHTIWLRNWMDFEDIPFRSQVVRKTEVKDDSNIWARAIGRTELPADSWVCGSEAQKNVAFHLFKTFELGTGNAGVGKTNNPWSFLWGSQKLNNYSCSKWGEELSGAMRTSNETWPSLEVQGKLSRENNFWIDIWKMNNSERGDSFQVRGNSMCESASRRNTVHWKANGGQSAREMDLRWEWRTGPIPCRAYQVMLRIRTLY